MSGIRLVMVDTIRIQPYIFGSNRLRENIGASHLVAEATETWALQIIQELTDSHNIGANGTLDRSKQQTTTTDLDVEVLYAGGGNYCVLFRKEEDAKVFAQRLSRKVLTEAPGLQIVIAQQAFAWHTSLYKTIETTRQKLTEQKRLGTRSAPLLGLGVTVMCQSTGLPAIGMTPEISDDETSVYPASAEIHAKIAVTWQSNDADSRLRTYIPPPGPYQYPSKLDELGRTKGAHSYIAVVHVDGDEIGKRFQRIGETYKQDNHSYIRALGEFSDAVKAAVRAALKGTVDKLSARIEQDGQIIHKNALNDEIGRVTLARRKNGVPLLPFRPLVFGGDDVTFVCDGRIGLSLAMEYLRQFEAQTTGCPGCGGKLTACAGIAIVKAHYPFARAYKLAEALCQSAKRYRRELKQSRPEWNGSCFDWHFAMSGLAGSIDQIHQREFTVKAGKLTLRPVTLNVMEGYERRSWQVIEKGIAAFQDLPAMTCTDEEPKWSTRRNKVKALRDALRGGPQAVRRFLTHYNQGQPLPPVEPSLPDWRTEGWHGGECGYFDAIELADWFIPLEKSQVP